MNILLFLTPKNEVAYVYDDYSIRQVLEKMEFHRYSAIPIINRNGDYVGTLTEGDILWYIKNNHQLNILQAENQRMTEIPRHHDNKAVSASCDLKDIIAVALNQNFIPVTDDDGTFIGIITRKNIFSYLSKNKTTRS